jgi:hypothetical protein
MLACTFENAAAYYDAPITASSLQVKKGPQIFRNTLPSLNALFKAFDVIAPTIQEGFLAKEIPEIIDHDIISGYIFNALDAKTINKYLVDRPVADTLIRKLPPIVDQVYEGKANKEIRLVVDQDTGLSLIEVVILTTLPIDDEFWKKDKQLYQGIQKKGLTEGLQYVVLSQG